MPNHTHTHTHRYKPNIQELDTKLRPFVPDYIPAVGDIDAFIKVGSYTYYDEY